MDAARRLFAIVVGVALGNLAVTLFLPVALLLDPRGPGVVQTLSAVALFLVAEAASDHGHGATRWAEAAAMLDVTLCLAPLVVAAAIGEAARSRSVFWYMLAPGAIAAAAPWLLRALSADGRLASASVEELRYALVFFLSGLVGGLVYWLLAGRRAGLAS